MKISEHELNRIFELTDLNDPAAAVYARLTQAQLRSKQEPEKGVLIAEGMTVIGHALDAGYEPLSFLMERRHITGKASSLLARCPRTPVYTADSNLLEDLTGFALTRGVLCAMKRPKPASMAQVCAHARRIAVMDGLVDGANVGAIFRNAAALGIDAVLLTPSCCDPLSRRTLRVSMGTVFQIPWARIGDTVKDWPGKGVDTLREMGFRTLALALDKRAVSMDALQAKEDDRLAIILGNEGNGLSPETVAACDETVIIPMRHGVDSLNVAAASAIAFWTLCK